MATIASLSARQRALERNEDGRRRGAEVTLQHVPVIGVDDARTRGRSAGGVVGRRGQPADQSRLGHVRVHDRRLQPLQLPVEANEAPQIVESARPDGRASTTKTTSALGLQEIAHVAFSFAKPSVKEPGAKPERLERRRQGASPEWMVRRC